MIHLININRKVLIVMKHVLGNCFEQHETLYQQWPKISLLHPTSINLICDASSIYSKGSNDISNAAVASAFVVYDPFTNNIITNALRPLSIRSNTNNFSEEISLLVGLENLHVSGIRQINHTVLNIYTDSTYVLSKFRPLFNHIKSLRHSNTPPETILQTTQFSTDVEQLVAYYLVLLNLDPNMYHLKAHTNNLSYISKDFKINNQVDVNQKELIYLTSVQSMVDSLATKIAKNVF